MIRPILLASAVVALPGMVAAQGLGFDGSVTLGASFNSTDISGTGVTLNGYSFDFDGDITLDPSISVGIGASMSTGTASVDGAPNEANVDFMSFYLEPQYNLGNGGYVGAYLRMHDIDFGTGGITIGADITSYGIFGGYDFGQGHVEVFYGMSELDDPNGFVGTDLEVTDYGISGSYQAMPELEVFASVIRTDIDISPISLPVTSYSVGADYGLGNGFNIYGAVGGATLDLSDVGAPDNITAVGLTLGGSYDLSASGGSMPMVLSAEYSRTNLDFAGVQTVDINRFALGLTIPLGNGSTDALNSNTRTARGDYRSALEAVANSF